MSENYFLAAGAIRRSSSTMKNNAEMRSQIRGPGAESARLLDFDVVLEWKVNSSLHDREIRLDNGWVVRIGRGLDIYQKP